MDQKQFLAITAIAVIALSSVGVGITLMNNAGQKIVIDANYEGYTGDPITVKITDSGCQLPSADAIAKAYPREEYVADGFSADPDADSADYAPGSSLTSAQVDALEKRTLYVVWVPEGGEVAVTVTLMVGDAVSGTATMTVGEEPAWVPSPGKKGYYFDGWYVSEGDNKVFLTDWQGTFNNAEGYVENGLWVYPDDLTMHAGYSAVTYEIIFHIVLGGTTEQKYTIESDDIVLFTPPREGYKFLGWFDLDGVQYTVIPHGSTGDLTLYAKWEAEN